MKKALRRSDFSFLCCDQSARQIVQEGQEEIGKEIDEGCGKIGWVQGGYQG